MRCLPSAGWVMVAAMGVRVEGKVERIKMKCMRDEGLKITHAAFLYLGSYLGYVLEL